MESVPLELSQLTYCLRLQRYAIPDVERSPRALKGLGGNMEAEIGIARFVDSNHVMQAEGLGR